MSRRPPIDKHPRITEIDRSLWNKEPLRSIAKRHDVSIAALSRRAQIVGANREKASRSDPPPAPTVPVPSSAPLAGPRLTAWDTSPNALSQMEHEEQDLALFDVASMSYPWREGEARNVDVMAEQLRITQRRFGLTAVRAAALEIVGRYRETLVPDISIARMLDVPVETIERWRELRQLEDRRVLLSTNATDRAARDLARLDQALAQCWTRIHAPKIGDRQFNASMALVLKLTEQREKLLERVGAPQRVDFPEPAPEDHATRMAREIQAGMLELLSCITEAQRVVHGDLADDES